MDNVFAISAAVGATLIVCQFLLSVLGIGSDHGDVSHSESGEPVDSHGSSWLFGKLTLRTIAAALAFFGLTGMAARKAELHDGEVLFLAVAAGLGAFVLVSWSLDFLTRLNFEGTVTIDQSVGLSGSVYVAIPGANHGAGKIHVRVSGRTLEYKAQTAGPGLATGTPIRVVAVVGHDIAIVEPRPEGDLSS